MKELNLQVGSMNLVALISEMNEDAMIALRPFVERLGLSWSTQAQKVQRNPQFRCVHMNTPSAGGDQTTLCIPVKQLGMWLCTVNAARVKPEIREKLIQFQMHLQVVIHDALTGRVTAERVRALEEQLAQALDLIGKLQFQLNQLTSASEYFASAASYGMHAAKKTRHLRVV